MEPGNHLRLNRGDDIRRIRWDGDAEMYVWSFAPDKGEKISAGAEWAADKAAEAFGLARQERQDGAR